MKPSGQHGNPDVSGSLMLFHAVWQKEAGHGTGWDITSPGEGEQRAAEQSRSTPHSAHPRCQL